MRQEKSLIDDSRPRTAKPAEHYLRRFAQKYSRELTLVGVLIIEIIVFANLSPHFLTLSNMFDATRYLAEFGFIALGMSLVIRTGGIDLSVGSTLALVSVIIGISYQAGLPIWVAIAAGLLAGVVCGTFNGFLIAHLGLIPLVVTLGTMALYRGVAYAVTGANAFSAFPLEFADISSAKIGPVPVQLILFIVVSAAVWLLVNRSRFGRYVGGVGYNAVATRYSGVRVTRVVMWVYILAAILVALAAILYTSRVFSARADAGIGIEFTAITAVVLGGASILGGRGSVTGTIIAVVILTYLQNGLIISSIPGELQGVIVGIALLFGVYFNSREGKGKSKKVTD